MRKLFLLMLFFLLNCSNDDKKMLEKCASEKLTYNYNLNAHINESLAEKSSSYVKSKKNIYKDIFSKELKGNGEKTIIEIENYYFNLPSTNEHFSNLMLFYSIRTKIIEEEFVKLPKGEKKKFEGYVSSFKMCEEEKKENPLTFEMQFK